MLGLESHPGIALEKHLLTVSEYIDKFCDDMQADSELRKAARLIALSHDLGKATSYFQDHLRGRRINPSLSSHALLSAILAVWHATGELPTQRKLPIFIAIRSHHSNPTNLSEMVYPKYEWPYLEKQAQSINSEQFSALLKVIGLKFHFGNSLLPSFDEFRVKFSWSPELKKVQGAPLYFITNLLLGMLVDADIRAVIEFKPNGERHEIPDDIVDRYIETLPPSSPIDLLRREFYNTVIENVQRHGLESKFLSLTAPTGIGKTLAGFSAALRLRNLIERETGRLSRIIYVLPFTSIIDQNFEVIKNVFRNAGLPEDILLKHHFRANPSEKTPQLKTQNIWKLLEENTLLKERDTQKLLKRYEQACTRVETWDGEVIITTFVRFYETLFTNQRSEMRRLHRLAGSIVILDEVQNIPPEYWEPTEHAFQFLAEKWDTKFILMTATRPALLQNSSELTEPKKKVFFEKLSRTKLHIDNKPVPYTEVDEWLLPKIESAQSFMAVMNTIRSAQDVYEILKNRLGDFELFFLSASLIPVHREARIQKIKEKLTKNQRIGLIATQVVEAGIDLDFDVVIRDLAPLDSIVQAAGRCNRNAKREAEGKTFLVKLVDPEQGKRRLATYIYDGILIFTTEELLQSSNVLPEKDYLNLVEKYFRKLREEGRKAQDKKLFESVNLLKYDELGMFTLIKQEIYQVPVFVEFDAAAEDLVKKLQDLEKMPAKGYEERLLRFNIFKSIAPNIWGYTVNVPAGVAANAGLTQLPFLSSFLWLPRIHPDFEKIYKEDTGFARKIEHGSIFL